MTASVKMKRHIVWVDSRVQPNSGIARYNGILLNHIERVCSDFEMKSWKDHFSSYTEKRISPFLAGVRFLYELLILPIIIKKAHIDIFHCTRNFGLPIFAKCKKILTIQDVIPLELKEYQGHFLSRLYYYWNFKLSCYGADRIICISEFTRKQLLAIFPALKPKVRVIYLGSSLLSASDDMTNISKGKPYILICGGAEPRKNVLFAAQNILADSRFNNYNLIILGELWHGRSLPDSIKNNPRVILPGKVSDSELAGLYQNASVFVFPSLYEGFGLPVLEAAACDIPVLAANASCMPEILKLPEILFEPGNSVDFCQKLNQILNSEFFREHIISKIRERSHFFSWDKTLSQTTSIYQELMKEGSLC